AVEGNRVEAAREHDAGAAFLRGLLVLGDHRRHPVRLTAKIDVIGAGLRACRQQAFAIALIGANGGYDDAGTMGERVERVRIRRASDDDGQRIRRADLGADRLELFLVAPGDGPAHSAFRSVSLEQMLGYQLAGETGRAIDDDIEFLCAHARPPCGVLWTAGVPSANASAGGRGAGGP